MTRAAPQAVSQAVTASAPPARAAMLAASLLAAAFGSVGCALLDAEPEGEPRKETVWAVTDAAELIRFNAGQPARVLERRPLVGLPADERLLGIDYRVARGTLYTLSSGGHVYTIDTASGRLARLGQAPAIALSGQRFGFDFNPVADRIRVVSDTGMNLRLHPDTGALAATDPALYAADEGARLASLGSASAAVPAITAAAYTYNKTNDKLTTNYAIDAAAGTLVMQGSREGATPAVSPNTGRVATVGALGTGPVEDAQFDIADIDNTALAALRTRGRTRLHLVDLQSGRALPLGTVGEGRALWGMAIEP
jgi:outer membrane protein assembly factor BamB